MTKFIVPIALLSLSAGLPFTVPVKPFNPNMGLIQKIPPNTTLSATEAYQKLLENQEIIELLKKYNGIITDSTETVTALKQQAAIEQLQNRMILQRFPIHTNEADAGKYAMRLAPVPDNFHSRMPTNDAAAMNNPRIIIEMKK